MRKYLTIIIVFISICFLVFIFGWFIRTSFELTMINVNEERFYRLADLVLKIIAVFGILRLYNAMVVNSRFQQKVAHEMKLLISELKMHAREIGKNAQGNNRAMSSLENAITSLKSIFQNLRK